MNISNIWFVISNSSNGVSDDGHLAIVWYHPYHLLRFHLHMYDFIFLYFYFQNNMPQTHVLSIFIIPHA